MNFRQKLSSAIFSSLLCLTCSGNTAPGASPKPLESVYLYSSPITSAFFSSNGASYDSLKQHWREYLRPMESHFARCPKQT